MNKTIWTKETLWALRKEIPLVLKDEDCEYAA